MKMYIKYKLNYAPNTFTNFMLLSSVYSNDISARRLSELVTKEELSQPLALHALLN